MPRKFNFPKNIKLCRNTEIEKVFKQGTYRSLGLIGVKYLDTSRQDSRFLIAIKRKVGSSPERNRLKRLAREAIRLHRSKLKKNLDVCLFITRRPRNKVTFSYVESKIIRLFNDLNK